MFSTKRVELLYKKIISHIKILQIFKTKTKIISVVIWVAASYKIVLKPFLTNLPQLSLSGASLIRDFVGYRNGVVTVYSSWHPQCLGTGCSVVGCPVHTDDTTSCPRESSGYRSMPVSEKQCQRQQCIISMIMTFSKNVQCNTT